MLVEMVRKAAVATMLEKAGRMTQQAGMLRRMAVHGIRIRKLL
jgi:hypothetical protein